MTSDISLVVWDLDMACGTARWDGFWLLLVQSMEIDSMRSCKKFQEVLTCNSMHYRHRFKLNEELILFMECQETIVLKLARNRIFVVSEFWNP